MKKTINIQSKYSAAKTFFLCVLFLACTSCDHHRFLVNASLQGNYKALKKGVTDDYQRALLDQWDSSVVENLPFDPVGIGDAIVLSYGPTVLGNEKDRSASLPEDIKQSNQTEESWDDPGVIDCRSWIDTTNNILYFHSGFFQLTTASIGAEVNLNNKRFEIFLLQSARKPVFAMDEDNPTLPFLRVSAEKQVLQLSTADIKVGDVIHGYLNFKSSPYFRKQMEANQLLKMEWNARFHFKIGVGVGTGTLEERFYEVK